MTRWPIIIAYGDLGLNAPREANSGSTEKSLREGVYHKLPQGLEPWVEETVVLLSGWSAVNAAIAQGAG